MEYTRAERYWIWLSSVNGMTPGRFYRLLTIAEDPVSVWEDPGEYAADAGPLLAAEIQKTHSESYIDSYLEKLYKLGITAFTRDSEGYPEALQHIHDAPPVLYVQGSTQIAPDRSIAMVGTRRPTYDGLKSAREFSKGLASNGTCIVSGLALGIDTVSHTGCLDAGGRTIAVLGNGLAGVYPRENAALARRILESGGSVVSEMRPDDPPSRWSFPQRNRIISGLSQATLVVEGSVKSGAMITAGFALEEGKDVFSIPGSLYNPLAEGTNRLIQSGASPALSYWDILEGMHWASRPGKRTSEKQRVPELDPTEKAVYTALKNEPRSFDELAGITNISVSQLNSCLTMLLLRGIIIKLPGNMYRIANYYGGIHESL